MKYLLSGAECFIKGRFEKADILISDGSIADISQSIDKSDGVDALSFDGCYIFPGLIDVHVHFREPGFFYKESIASGSAAAARGGYTSVCTMPNLNPVPDSAAHLKEQTDIIAGNSVVNIYPFAAITVGEKGERLSDMENMHGIAGFSDDGKGVMRRGVMLDAMKKAKNLGMIISAHCEDETLLRGGYIHDGEYAARNNHKGICSACEYEQLRRDLELVKQTGVKYHVCHVSAKESVELIRQAKRDGLDITCETAPHYLVLCEDDLLDDGRFKMNPPLRTKEDRQALLDGIKDGTIDIIATDHAPHSQKEKSLGLRESTMGVSGLECAFAVLYTRLVKTGVITLSRLLELMSVNPSKRFNIGGALKVGLDADLTVFDLSKQYKINPAEFLSKGKATPFEGMTVYGRCKMTMVKGKTVWQENITKK